MATIVKLTLH